MKLLRLHVKRYGHFADVPFDFGGDGLKLVLGPNEAGKTTLLEFIRELLFGFAERNDYDFGQGRLEGEATMRLESGQLVELRRHKGRKNTVSVRIDDRETAQDAAGFNSLLGNASANLFRSVFAFGLQELAAAEKGLADENVRSALFSGGLATVASPKKILDTLETEASALYKERGQKAVINTLCGDLKNLQTQIKERSIRCESYEERRTELEQALAGAKQVDAHLAQLTREHSLASKLARAIPVWLEGRSLRQERQGLCVPDGFPAVAKEQFEKLQGEIDRLEGEETEQNDAIGDIELALKALSVDPRLLERKADIEHVQQMIQSVKDARRDLPLREGERDRTLRAVEDELAELVPGWTTTELEAFRVTAADKAELGRLTSEKQSLEKGKAALESEQVRLAEDLRDAQSELARLGDPVDVSVLAGLLDEEADYTSNKKDLIRLRREDRKAATELAALLPRLNPPLTEPTAAACELPVPPRETADQFKLDQSWIRQMLVGAEKQMADVESNLETLQRELAILTAAKEVPTRDGLLKLRSRRDAGWALIRRKHVAGEDASMDVDGWLGGTHRSLPDAYEDVVREADRYGDNLFDKSSAVAKQDQIAVVRQQLDHKRQELNELRSGDKSIRQRWEELWRGCGFAPLEPEAMSSWLDNHRALCQLVEKTSHLTSEVEALSEQISRYESRLREALESREKDGSSLLVAARKRVEAATEKARRRHDLELALARLQNQAGDMAVKRDQHAESEQTWLKRWQAMLLTLGFPKQWELELTQGVLSRLATARVNLQKVRDAERPIADMKERLQRFDPLVRTICEDLASDLLDKPTEVAASTLRARLTDSLAAQEQKAVLEKNQTAGRKKLRDLERRRQGAREQVLALFTAAGVADPAAFLQVAERAERIARLDADISGKERELAIIRENEPLEAFAQQLQEADLVLLNDRLRDLSAGLEAVRSEKTAADQHVGACQRALAELEKGGGDAAKVHGEAASRRAQLADAVDRYVPLLFARHLLQQAIQRFEQESQPEMLKEVSRIFQSMTGNRYGRVERPLAESAPLLIHRDNGDPLEPSQLSTGTREQLYLAIRLAYVLHYCGRAEPLPIVMDDVLANFDDDRARQTLRGLGEIANRVQVIMFTCHPHLVNLAHQVFPGLEPIQIPRSGPGP